MIRRESLKDQPLSIKDLCLLSGVSRSGYYRWVAAAETRLRREKQDQADFENIKMAYDFRGYAKGYRSIRMRLLRMGIRMNHKKIIRLMKKFGLKCPIRRLNPYRQMARALRTETSPYCRTQVFYCDPSSPYQKGACEVNHELIRRILPKGSSFDDLTQEDIFLMMDHINSYKRKKLNDRSPYETFSFYYGEDLLKKLGCSPVASENIILKPKLLKK